MADRHQSALGTASNSPPETSTSMKEIIKPKTIESDYFGILAFLTGGIAFIPWYYWIGKTTKRMGVSFAGLMTAFEEAGHPVDDPLMSINDFAHHHGVSSETLFALARPQATGAADQRRPPERRRGE